MNTGSLSLEPTLSAIIMHCLLLVVFVLVIFVINKLSLSGTMPEHYSKDWGCQRRKDVPCIWEVYKIIKLKFESQDWAACLWRAAQTAFASEWTIHHTGKVLNVSSKINYEIPNISLLHSALRWALELNDSFQNQHAFRKIISFLFTSLSL